MRERPELDRDALAEAREEGHGHFIAGLAALRTAAGRQAKALDQDKVKAGLKRIVGRNLVADEPAQDAVTESVRDQFRQALGRGMPYPQKKPLHELKEERESQCQLERERQRELDRPQGWEL